MSVDYMNLSKKWRVEYHGAKMRAQKKRWAKSMAWRAEQNPDVTMTILEKRLCEL
jgi:hypothetical protein